jgi:hypothetical protein
VLLDREERFGPRRRGCTRLSILTASSSNSGLPVISVEHRVWKVNGGSFSCSSVCVDEFLMPWQIFRALLLYRFSQRMM